MSVTEHIIILLRDSVYFTRNRLFSGPKPMEKVLWTRQSPDLKNMG
jgi:hypothetical protein